MYIFSSPVIFRLFEQIGRIFLIVFQYLYKFMARNVQKDFNKFILFSDLILYLLYQQSSERYFVNDLKY